MKRDVKSLTSIVKGDTTIADLHHYLQIIMGSENEHLHQFIIRQGSYSIWFEGGMSFDAAADKIFLKDFELTLSRSLLNSLIINKYHF